MQPLKMMQVYSVLRFRKITKKYSYMIKEKCRIDVLPFMGGGVVIEHINLFFCKCTEYLWQETQ